MRFHLSWSVVVLLLVGVMPAARGDNLLKNADFKEGSQLWRGDGQAAFLKPDGTEGEEGDPGVVPVMRVSLSRGMRHVVYQEFDMKAASSTLNVQLQVYASIDFKRSPHAEDYVSDDYTPIADFDFRMMPDYADQQASLKPGEWVTVKGSVPTSQPADRRAIYFFIPPGAGVVYLKAVSVSP